jgi:Rrf2 family protein
MRLITKETDYAIRAVVNLARRPGAFTSSAEISAQEQIPLPFLRRILQRLLKAGLVVSREGIAGGVSLKPRPEGIQILDVMKVFQGEVELSKCMFRRRLCANRGACVLRQRIKEIERSLTAQFADITIADLRGDLRGQACKPARSNRVDRARRPARQVRAGDPRGSGNKKRGAR